jgi:hypothetical protein
VQSSRNPLHDRSGQLPPEAWSVLSRYSLAEQVAILDHRFYLSIALERQASFDETLRSWEAGAGRPWRETKMVRDRTAQVKEIERHKWFMSQHVGRDIGWEPAAFDWIEKHAAAWRDWWELHWWEKQWWEQPGGNLEFRF